MSQEPQNQQNHSGQTIIINQTEKQNNGAGIAGFVLSILAIFLGWIPFFGWILWLLGLIFSFIGIFNKPNGLSIAGLVISLVGLLLLVLVFGALLGSATYS